MMMQQQSLFDLPTQRSEPVALITTHVRGHQRRVGLARRAVLTVELQQAEQALALACAAYQRAVEAHSSGRRRLALAKTRAAALVLRLETRIYGPVVC